ncbi:MAG: class I SAM-dependent rRNA methyltransferase [Rhodospirillales bacterium]|nr:class I SAM-dependent rRNA methyltransferase [Rhodospirillales bacterium]
MPEPAALPDLFLKPGADRRALAGGPWIYSNEVRLDDRAKAIEPGAAVAVRRADGKPVGAGTFNPHRLIAVRLYAAEPRPLDAALFEERIRRAAAIRERLYKAAHYRLVHAEADGLPGLVIDRFGDVCVVQPNTRAMDARIPSIVAALDAAIRPTAVLVRADSPARAHEGLTPRNELARGRLDGAIDVIEESGGFRADPESGQKTGWFFDQRDSRLFVQRLSAGASVLDLFCHAGGFALAAARAGARTALGIDSSAAALSLAAEAAQRHGAGAADVRWQKADAFDALDALASEGRTFDVVVADPPAFVKSKKDLAAGLKGYRKLARMAAGRVARGGFLFIASCSHNVPADAFAAEVATGLNRTGRAGRVLRAGGAGADHPVHPHLPESAYLKTLTLALD